MVEHAQRNSRIIKRVECLINFNRQAAGIVNYLKYKIMEKILNVKGKEIIKIQFTKKGSIVENPINFKILLSHNGKDWYYIEDYDIKNNKCKYNHGIIPINCISIAHLKILSNEYDDISIGN